MSRHSEENCRDVGGSISLEFKARSTAGQIYILMTVYVGTLTELSLMTEVDILSYQLEPHIQSILINQAICDLFESKA